MKTNTVIYLSPEWKPADNHFVCPVPTCNYHSEYSTLKGHRNGMIKHMLTHGFQLIFGKPPAGGVYAKITELRNKLRKDHEARSVHAALFDE